MEFNSFIKTSYSFKNVKRQIIEHEQNIYNRTYNERILNKLKNGITDEIITPDLRTELANICCNITHKKKKKKLLFIVQKKTHFINKKRSPFKINENQIYDYKNMESGNNHQNSLSKSLKINELYYRNEPKSDDGIKYNIYGLPTFSRKSKETQRIIPTQQFLIKRNLSEQFESEKEIEIEIEPFNFEMYNNNYIKYKTIKFDEPKFKSYNYIMNKYQKDIAKVWSQESQIFENENDFYNTLKNGKIYQNVLMFLSEKKRIKAKKRKYDPDGMINKIKTELLDSILNYINSFDEMKNNEIYKLKKNLINNKIGADFNLHYLKQKLYNILSNDSSEQNINSNNKKIKILKENNPSFFNQYFCQTIQNCLDIFRYNQNDPHFKNKLVEFLKKKYIGFKDDFAEGKDYIASLILLV